MATRPVHSHLAQSLILDWSDGALSSVGVVRHARAARRDGNQVPMLNGVASLGSSNYNNCYREFKDEIIVKGGIYAQMTSLPGPIFNHCVLPSIILRILSQRPSSFRNYLGAERSIVRQFWTSLFSTPQGMEFKRLHPQLRDKTIAELESKFPLRVHEDAGPFSKSMSVDLICWSSLLGLGTELHTKYDAI